MPRYVFRSTSPIYFGDAFSEPACPTPGFHLRRLAQSPDKASGPTGEHPQYLRVLYTVSEIGQDVSSASRTASQSCRTTFLRAIKYRRLHFSTAQQRDLVQYLKSLVPRLVAKISWMKVTSAREQVVWELKNEIQ
jgi:hypothetical protein